MAKETKYTDKRELPYAGVPEVHVVQGLAVAGRLCHSLHAHIIQSQCPSVFTYYLASTVLRDWGGMRWIGVEWGGAGCIEVDWGGVGRIEVD